MSRAVTRAAGHRRKDIVMTSALPHQHTHRSQALVLVAVVLALLLAVFAVGAVLEINRDSAPASPSHPQLVLTHVHLRGSDHMVTSWKHAGTSSGGHTVLGQ
jgi:hypothetical protein